MQKTILLIYTITVITLSILACSGFDTYTTAGSEVIDEYNSTITDFEKNFYPISFDTSIVAEEKSITSVDTSRFGGMHVNRLAAGDSGGTTIFGYSEFIISKSWAIQFDSSTNFDSITFLYDTLGSTTYKSSFENSTEMYLCPAERSEMYQKRLPPDTSEENISCTLKQSSTISESDTTFHFSGKCDNSTLVDSIFNLIATYVKCNSNDDAEECSDLDDSTRFSFALFNRNPPIWFYSEAAIIIHSSKEITTGDSEKKEIVYLSDTIRAASFYMVIESDSLKTARENLPVSCYSSGRVAVFKIDLAPFWDSVAHSGFNNILSAAIILEADTLYSGSINDVAQIQYEFTDSSVTDFAELLAHITDIGGFTPETDQYPYVYLQGRFTQNNFLSSNDITISLSRHLQRDQENHPRYYYLYVQIESINTNIQQEILWKKPRLKAILTTTR